MYRVVIVDDEPIIVEGISRLVPWKKYECSVCACAYSGKEVWKSCAGKNRI